MAEWDRDWREKRDREEEKEKEFEALKRQRQNKSSPGTMAPGQTQEIDLNPASAKFDELIDRVTPLIEQVHSLYNQYFSGAEQRPPLERRKHLDQIMDTLVKMSKVTATQRFKFQGAAQQYATYRDRWDKRLKELEEGKIRRGGGS